MEPVGVSTTESAGSAALKIKTSKLPVPLLWLDTWVFVRLAKWRAGEIDGEDGKKLAHLYERLVALRDEHRLITPETGHDLEIEAGARLVDETRTIMSQVSLGVSTHFRIGRDAQIHRALRAYAERQMTIEMPWRDVFTEDPIAEIGKEGPLIRVDLNTSRDELAQHLRSSEELATKLEAIRLDARSRHETFEQRLAIELRGVIDATVEIERSLTTKIASAVPASADEWIRYAFEVGRWKRTLAKHLDEKGAGATDDDLANLIRFYESPWWSEIPAIRIICELYALKLTGSEAIRASDVMDMEQIAVLLPFADAMVLDRSMADKVRRLRLPERYGTNVLTGIDELIDWLSHVESPGTARP